MEMLLLYGKITLKNFLSGKIMSSVWKTILYEVENATFQEDRYIFVSGEIFDFDSFEEMLKSISEYIEEAEIEVWGRENPKFHYRFSFAKGRNFWIIEGGKIMYEEDLTDPEKILEVRDSLEYHQI